MNEIRTILGLARRKIEATIFLAALHATAIVFALLALAFAVADRAPAAPFLAWTWVGPALVLGALAGAALRWWRRRPSELEVALAVDDRLELRERISTALACGDREDAFAQAAVADAVATARDPRTRETVRRRFAVAAPRRWWISPLLLAVTAGLLLLPQASLFAADKEPGREQAVAEARRQAEESLEVVTKAVTDKPELNRELAGLVDELSEQSRAPDTLREPEQVKREALKKVTELNRRLDEIVNGEKGKTAEALRRMMAGIHAPESGSAKEIAEALARGDYAAAKKALEDLLEQAKTGDLDAAQIEALARQLQGLGQQLDRLAAARQQLAQALQQAGLDPQLAGNPQALEQALQQAPNLNDQQRRRIMQMARAQQQARQMTRGLAGAMQQMAGQLHEGQLGAAGRAGLQQLGQMEQLHQLLQEAQAAASQCRGQGRGLGLGMTLTQAMQQWTEGSGMGRRGSGAGGRAPISPTPTGTQLTKAQTPVGEGEIIASMLIDGVPVRGEARATLRKVQAAVARGYDEAQTEQDLPRQYDTVQKHYFGELQKQVKAVQAMAEEEAGGDDPAADRKPEPTKPAGGEV